MQPRDLLTAKEAQVALMVSGRSHQPRHRPPPDTTEQVIKNYLRNTVDKLGVWSRLELALYVASHGGTKWQDDLTPAPEAPARIAASGD